MSMHIYSQHDHMYDLIHSGSKEANRYTDCRKELQVSKAHLLIMST